VVGEWVHVVNTVTMWIAVVLTVASGVDYVVTEIRGARAARGGTVTGTRR
jgi:CDP-diacylglycerol--glycerol-3-phosphate 3-phosphatidyltransferase